jgi:hypothetical protein
MIHEKLCMMSLNSIGPNRPKNKSPNTCTVCVQEEINNEDEKSKNNRHDKTDNEEEENFTQEMVEMKYAAESMFLLSMKIIGLFE